MAAAKKKPEAGKRLDLTFLSFVLILLTTGLVMLFSASYAYSYEYYGNSYKFITRQAAFAAAGVALMLIISKIDYHFWRRFAWIVYGVHKQGLHLDFKVKEFQVFVTKNNVVINM